MNEVWTVGSREEWEQRVDWHIASSAAMPQAETPVVTDETSPSVVDVLLPSSRFAVSALEQGVRVIATRGRSMELRESPNGDLIQVGDEEIVVRGGVRKQGERNAPHYHVSVNDYRENLFPSWTNATRVKLKQVRHQRISRRGSY